MDVIQNAFDPNKITMLAGQPNYFLVLLIVAVLSLFAAFLLDAHIAVKAPIWAIFLTSDAAVIYLILLASPALTDYDYGATIETPSATVVLTGNAQTSAKVCVPLASFDLGNATKEVDSYCDHGGAASQNYFVYGISDRSLCYNVTVEPNRGQQCRSTAFFRSIERHRRDGLLQKIHGLLRRDQSEAGQGWPSFPDY